MDSPLKKFSAEEWDCWLTDMADCYVQKPTGFWADGCYECLFCFAFDFWCKKCFPNGGNCNDISDHEKVDRAIERLYREGVFVDE